MNNAISKEKNFTLDYIRLYRQLPELWDVKSKDYHDRYKKKAGYETLLRKYREFYTDATMEDLKKKLNSLRTNYRKQLRKYLINKDHKPPLWYFEEMCFLNNIEFSQDLEASEIKDFSMEYVDEEDTVFSSESSSTSDHRENDNLYKDLPANSKRISSKSTNNEVQHLSIRKDRNVRRKSDRHKDFSPLNQTCALRQTHSEDLQSYRDEYFHWAMACAADLRYMERTQQLYAKKAIAEILMEGQLGTLNRDSVKINNQLDSPILVKISPSSPTNGDDALLQNEQS